MTIVHTIARNKGLLGDRAVQVGKWISLGTIAGPVLFMIAWVALGVLQPETKGEYGVIGGFSGAVTNPISALGVGPHAGLFNCTFILCGLVTLIGVLGALEINRCGPRTAISTWCAVLLALSPLGLLLAGIFTLATSLLMHNVAAFLVFVVPLAAFPVGALYLRSMSGWHRLGNGLLSAAPLTLVLLVLFVASFHLSAVVSGRGVAGLTERLLLCEIHAWYAALGWRGFRG
jgi:ethanolamine transporter EutH